MRDAVVRPTNLLRFDPANSWHRCFGKGLDNFAPLGPVLVHPTLFNPSSVNIYTRLNGDTMQKANTSDLISDVPKILHHFSKGTTLEKGSLILTGTPEGAYPCPFLRSSAEGEDTGVGYARKPRVFLRDGDKLEVEVDGLGVLRHGIKYE